MKPDILGSADQRRVSDQHHSSCGHQAAGQQRRRTGQQDQVGLFMRVKCKADSNECLWRDGFNGQSVRLAITRLRVRLSRPFHVYVTTLRGKLLTHTP